MDLDGMLFKPGFAHLKIESNADELDYHDMASFQFGINVVSELEKTASTRPEVNAYRNFLGYLAIKLEWYGEAIFYFKKALGSDNNNLNALHNLMLIYKLNGWVKQKQQTARRMDQVQKMLSTNDDRAKVIKARCLAEKGFLICKDTDYIHEQEFERAKDMYSWAIKNAGDLVPREERVYWYFGRLTATQILYTKQTMYRNPQHHRTRMLQLCREFFSDRQQVVDHGDDLIMADTWCKTALFLHSFRKNENHGLRQTECLPQDILRIYDESNASAICYARALRYKPNDPDILSKIARELTSNVYRVCDFATAFELLDRSISLDSSICNRSAFYIRAEAYQKLYRQLRDSPEHDELCHIRRKRTKRDNNWRLLIKAKYDFEKSLKLHVEPTDCRILGDIFCDLAKEHCNRHGGFPDEPKIHYLEMALRYYNIAKDMPAGSTNPHLHYKIGECLRQLNRLDEAVDSYKESIKCQIFDTDSMELVFRKLNAVHKRIQQNAELRASRNKAL